MIPTAEEFLKNLDKESNGLWTEDDSSICKAFIEFTKIHVQKALKEASEKAKLKYDHFDDMAAYVDESSILNAYPLENIK
jgi:hypothetical protein